MDERAYRQVMTSTVSLPCPFEKSILTRCVACAKSDKHNVAEREIVSCSDQACYATCVTLRDALRNNFNFALGKRQIDGPLPHAQEMLIQCGGLRAMQFTVVGDDEVSDVSLLVSLAQKQFGDLAEYPYSQIVQLAKGYYKSR